MTNEEELTDFDMKTLLEAEHGNPALLAGPGLDIAEDDKRFLCGDSKIKINREGEWSHNGTPFTRKDLMCLFASMLQRDDDGKYWLISDFEMAEITVEDAPFMAVEMFVDSSGRDQTISFRTNIDEMVTVDDQHPLRISIDPRTEEPSPYVLVRPGFEARMTRSVFYELVDRGIEETFRGERIFGIWSRENFFPLIKMDA